MGRSATGEVEERSHTRTNEFEKPYLRVRPASQSYLTWPGEGLTCHPWSGRFDRRQARPGPSSRGPGRRNHCSPRRSWRSRTSRGPSQFVDHIRNGSDHPSWDSWCSDQQGWSIRRNEVLEKAPSTEGSPSGTGTSDFVTDDWPLERSGRKIQLDEI